MRDKIVTAVLGDDLYVRTSHVFQYDYGLELMIEGIELPAEYEVHFSNKKRGVAKKGELVEGGAKIPDEYLRSGDNVYAWVYLRNGDDDGYTIYSIEIPVVQRSVEQGDNIDIIEHNIIDKTIEELKEAVAKSEENVTHYPYIDTETHHWMVYDANQKTFVDTGVDAEGEVTDVIDDASGAGVTDKAWSADKLTTEFDAKENKPDMTVMFTLAYDSQNDIWSVTADKTASEIADALNAGKTVRPMSKYEFDVLGVTLVSELSSIVAVTGMGGSNGVMAMGTPTVMDGAIDVMILGRTQDDQWMISVAQGLLATWGRDYNAANKKITNLADPTASADAVTKKYVDNTVFASKIRTYTITLQGNTSSMDAYFTGGLNFVDEEFTDKSRIIGYFSVNDKYYVSFNYTINPKELKYSITILPGAPSGSIDLFIAEIA